MGRRCDCLKLSVSLVYSGENPQNVTFLTNRNRRRDCSPPSGEIGLKNKKAGLRAPPTSVTVNRVRHGRTRAVWILREEG
jgi:hypothetical protein